MTATRSWDTSAPTRPHQAVIAGFGILALVPGLVATALRLVPPTDDGPALLASFIPYGLFGYLVAALCFGIATARAGGGRRAMAVLTVVSLAGLVLHLSWLAPLYVSDARPVTGRSFTVVSLNVDNGEADAAAVTDAAAAADIVILIEVTPAWHQSTANSALRDRFPYVAGSPVQGSSGSAIYSRFRLADGEPLPPSSFQQWAATADVPYIGALRLVAVHPCNPYCGANRWTSEHTALRAYLREQDDTRLLVAGDFNAVPDHGPMQALRRDGLRSAADLAGAGRLPSFPADSAAPVLTIDHVLLSEGLTATAVETFRVPGTDHLGLRTTVAATQ